MILMMIVFYISQFLGKYKLIEMKILLFLKVILQENFHFLQVIKGNILQQVKLDLWYKKQEGPILQILQFKIKQIMKYFALQGINQYLKIINNILIILQQFNVFRVNKNHILLINAIYQIIPKILQLQYQNRISMKIMCSNKNTIETKIEKNGVHYYKQIQSIQLQKKFSKKMNLKFQKNPQQKIQKFQMKTKIKQRGSIGSATILNNLGQKKRNIDKSILQLQMSTRDRQISVSNMYLNAKKSQILEESQKLTEESRDQSSKYLSLYDKKGYPKIKKQRSKSRDSNTINLKDISYRPMFIQNMNQDINQIIDTYKIIANGFLQEKTFIHDKIQKWDKYNPQFNFEFINVSVMNKLQKFKQRTDYKTYFARYTYFNYKLSEKKRKPKNGKNVSSFQNYNSKKKNSTNTQIWEYSKSKFIENAIKNKNN